MLPAITLLTENVSTTTANEVQVTINMTHDVARLSTHILGRTVAQLTSYEIECGDRAPAPREITEMTKDSLRELYVDELKDLYSAEKQLTKALPKMAKAASSEELKSGFEEHLEQTKNHVQRLEQVFEQLGEKPTGKKCLGMEGLINEGSSVMQEDFSDEVMDAALISAAQRVEHYEIAAYGTVCAYAELLGESEQNSLLNETLNEEKETDQKLTELSREINVEAQGEGGEAEEEAEDTQSRRKPRTTRGKSRRVA